MVFNTTFNNISVISWWSVLLVERTDLSQVTDKLYHILVYRVPRENHGPVTSHCQTLSHNSVTSTPCLSGVQTHNVTGDKP